MNNQELLQAMLDLDMATLNTLQTTVPLEGVLELVINAHKLGRVHSLQEYKNKLVQLEAQNGVKDNTGGPPPTTNASQISAEGGKGMAVQSPESGAGANPQPNSPAV